MKLQFDAIAGHFLFVVTAHQFLRLSTTPVENAILDGVCAPTFPEYGVLADEFSVHSSGVTEIYCYLNYEKAVVTAGAQNDIDLFVRETSFVVRHNRDLPRLEPTF